MTSIDGEKRRNEGRARQSLVMSASQSNTSMSQSARRSGAGLHHDSQTRQSARARQSIPQNERQSYRVGMLALTSEAEKAKDDGRAVVWLDIDNTLYRKSTKIAEMMSTRIRAYILSLGLSEEEAEELHKRYYKQYGLAIRGLVAHHKIDALEYDARCDATLPLDEILKPDQSTINLLSDLDRSKCRVWALTNAYKTHALRVLRLLRLDDLVEGIIYCDYAMPNFACKPEKEFYLGALHYVGLKDSKRCYFVDDSLLNIRAAKQLGWQSCVLFKEVETTEDDTSGNKGVTESKFDVGVLHTDNSSRNDAFDEATVTNAVSKLSEEHRMKLLRIVLQTCSLSDVSQIQKLLDRESRSTLNLPLQLPSNIIRNIFAQLSLCELTRCRRVCRDWQRTSFNATLWQPHALKLLEGEPVDHLSLLHEEEWEVLAKTLTIRARNWERGLCQNIKQMPGHTGFVTAMKLKGNSTLVTGSYDETIRVWDLTDNSCTKVLKAKAISCLDFLANEGILAAGLYDSGRILVWDMKTWTLLQTLSGHNHGIRNVALNDEYLVSVGQDKAIVVWDWRSGTKVVRFGQQSSVSLGVSVVDHDKIVAVTVDGVIRTFDVSAAGKREMIGQFDLAKLAPELGARLAGLKDGTLMMQWFAAHGNTMTIGSSSCVVHLQWCEHIVPVVQVNHAVKRSQELANSPTKASTKSKFPSGTPNKLTSRKLAQSLISTASDRTSRSPTPVGKSDELNGTQTPPTTKTRLAPNLSSSPLVLEVVDFKDGAVGAVDAVKKRIVCSTRFSSRTGAERQLYTATFGAERSTSSNVSIVPIGGAWQSASKHLAVPERNPMSIVLNGNHCIVGTSEGLIYDMTFDGSMYTERKPLAAHYCSTADQQVMNKDGDAVIADLDELRNVWSELFI